MPTRLNELARVFRAKTLHRVDLYSTEPWRAQLRETGNLSQDAFLSQTPAPLQSSQAALSHHCYVQTGYL
ncbi:hypothetical protein LF1_10140 [Rubripirellula obstinata]|uniref:Uncharacterized protein n=1 Tax=Rubripirellula obstinata TaxID=406547 RepID=A0A5B1CH13_9BACT|nr:hypothetical protein LF1_10140 [Rubripirellula obstinata]